MSSSVVSKYEYTHDAGSAPNRKVEFFRSKSGDPKTLYAIVSAKSSGEWEEIAKVFGDDISVDMLKTARKTGEYFEDSELRRFPEYFTFVEKGATALCLDDQTEILTQLQPKGEWSVLRTIDAGKGSRFEKIVALSLFNPRN